MGLHESKGLECHRTSPEGQEQGHDNDEEEEEEEEEQDTAVAPLLHVAARKGRLEAARRLLSQGAEAVNGQDAGGRTALFWATEFRHEGLAQLLLSRGADPAARDHEGNSCLHWAAYVGHVPIARLLLEAGAELNVPNAQGDTPLHVAAQEGSDECLALLLAHGAKVSLKNQAGQLPLHYAALGSPSWRALHTFSALPPQQVERILCRDISRGFENIPIPCLNGVDNEPCPHDFLYITQNLISESVAFLATGWGRSQRCQCQGPCSAASCPCILRSKHTWYTADGQLALDSTSSTAEMAPIYECSQLCSCGSSCPNRLVQQGIRTQLQLYRIAAKGWGVRTMQDVSQGTFICQYFGELISCTEAARRAEDTYYFVVDIKAGQECCLDGRHYGSVGRFLNHSCQPNLVALQVAAGHEVPGIAFFSTRAIQAGEELGFDYGDDFWEKKAPGCACLCRAPTCRFPPPPPGRAGPAPSPAAGDSSGRQRRRPAPRGFALKSKRASPLKGAPRLGRRAEPEPPRPGFSKQ